MISHGYENGYRTLGRQILLEPIRWGEDGWPEAVGGDLGATASMPRRRRRPDAGVATVEDDFSQLLLGARWSFHAPGPGEADRARHR